MVVRVEEGARSASIVRLAVVLIDNATVQSIIGIVLPIAYLALELINYGPYYRRRLFRSRGQPL